MTTQEPYLSLQRTSIFLVVVVDLNVNQKVQKAEGS